MGTIVSGFGTAHIVMKRGSGGEAGERVFAGMKEVGARVRSDAPDVLVIVSSDHMYNYDLNLQAPFAVATDDEHVPFGDMDLPKAPLPGHGAFAHGLLDFAAANDFDLARLQGYRPDHGIVLPALLASPQRTIPIVPIIVNTGMDPVPRLTRAWRLGEILARYVADARPENERVVVMGTGGLSHWLGVAEMGRTNPLFDHAVMDAITSGRGVELTRWTSDHVYAEGGNGGHEILNWMVMAGSLPNAFGERVYYENVPAWITGMGGIHLRPRS
jgi:aromatic ring-opening dioxygenase catalytic subunit (LigB family)